MSRRVSTRVKRKASISRESEHQPAHRCRQGEQLEEQVSHIPNPTSTSGSNADDLVARVTNAISRWSVANAFLSVAMLGVM